MISMPRKYKKHLLKIYKFYSPIYQYYNRGILPKFDDLYAEVEALSKNCIYFKTIRDDFDEQFVTLFSLDRIKNKLIVAQIIGNLLTFRKATYKFSKYEKIIDYKMIENGSLVIITSSQSDTLTLYFFDYFNWSNYSKINGLRGKLKFYYDFKIDLIERVFSIHKEDKYVISPVKKEIYCNRVPPLSKDETKNQEEKNLPFINIINLLFSKNYITIVGNTLINGKDKGCVCLKIDRDLTSVTYVLQLDSPISFTKILRPSDSPKVLLTNSGSVIRLIHHEYSDKLSSSYQDLKNYGENEDVNLQTFTVNTKIHAFTRSGKLYTFDKNLEFIGKIKTNFLHYNSDGRKLHFWEKDKNKVWYYSVKLDNFIPNDLLEKPKLLKNISLYGKLTFNCISPNSKLVLIADNIDDKIDFFIYNLNDMSILKSFSVPSGPKPKIKYEDKKLFIRTTVRGNIPKAYFYDIDVLLRRKKY